MIVISLGSNLGNRLDHLWRAVQLIHERCLKNAKSSIILETAAIVPEDAPADWDKPFLNMIIVGETHLCPESLLRELKNIESEMGRPEAYAKWAPRIIDLDILFYKNLTIHTAELRIPHPEIHNRPFIQHLLALMHIKPWGIDHNLQSSFTKSYCLEPRLVGVINITQDSFSDGGNFYNTPNAIDQILKLEEDGASIIELGAQSTRPGASIQSVDEEYRKLDEVLSAAVPIIHEKKIKLSIDTFHPSIALQLIKKYPIEWINDVKGDFDDESLRAIADHGCQFCLMHSLSIPPNKNHIPSSIDPLDYLLEWGERSLAKLSKLGFARENIILDPGIGFGKNPYQSISILKNIHRFKNLECKMMIGHSRKSYIQAFSKEANPCNRDIETIAISLAIAHKADFLRVHNVRDHVKAMVAHHLLNG